MRLAFLVGSLEPGRDGVGDYCRQLGLAAEKLGHTVLSIALNDRWLEARENKSASVLRLSASVVQAQRTGVVQEALREFCPDWVSLQYVCYAFHPKGMAWQWNPAFAKLGVIGKRRHLMFHELWSGEGGRPPLRHRIIGLGQRLVIRDLHQRFRPDLVTTSTQQFQHRLARRGIAAKVLPLFGNIPVSRRDDDRVVGLLGAAGSRTVQRPRNSYLQGIIFGTVHPDFDAQPLAGWLAELQRRAAKPVVLSMVGRGGTASGRFAEQLIKSVPCQLEVVSLGEQQEETISQSLQFADFGINTGSPEYLCKSGTFAAMREHGLPVVLADGRLDSTPAVKAAPPVLQFSAKDSVSKLLSHARHSSSGAGAAQTALDMIQLFEQATA